jgi:hypothetical protein
MTEAMEGCVMSLTPVVRRDPLFRRPSAARSFANDLTLIRWIDATFWPT